MFRHEVAGLFMGQKHRLDPLAQWHITTAGLVQIRRALLQR